MLITSEQTGQFILRKVMSLTVVLAPQEAHTTDFCGIGIPGRIGNCPGAGGIGSSPGAGGSGSGGKSSNFGSMISSTGSLVG